MDFVYGDEAPQQREGPESPTTAGAETGWECRKGRLEREAQVVAGGEGAAGEEPGPSHLSRCPATPPSPPAAQHRGVRDPGALPAGGGGLAPEQPGQPGGALPRARLAGARHRGPATRRDGCFIIQSLAVIPDSPGNCHLTFSPSLLPT
jgi:hypothetical protein